MFDSSKFEVKIPEAEKVTVTEDALMAELSDGRTISVPLAWYPRLVHAAQEERDNWELIGNGQGIRWPDLDEDLSVEGLIGGRPSGESQKFFKRWLEAKRAGRSMLLYDLAHAQAKDAMGEQSKRGAGVMEDCGYCLSKQERRAVKLNVDKEADALYYASTTFPSSSPRRFRRAWCSTTMKPTKWWMWRFSVCRNAPPS